MKSSAVLPSREHSFFFPTRELSVYHIPRGQPNSKKKDIKKKKTTYQMRRGKDTDQGVYRTALENNRSMHIISLHRVKPSHADLEMCTLMQTWPCGAYRTYFLRQSSKQR